MSDGRKKHDEPFEWPEEQGPPSEDELRAARAHAERLERLLAGDGPEGDDLAGIAGMIRHSEREKTLGDERAAAILDEAMRASTTTRRQSRLAPVIALAAAVLVAIGLTLGIGLRGGQAPSRRGPGGYAFSAEMLSRSSNALLGKPIVDRAGASQRLDRVFVSRMAGYRALRLSQGRSP